MRIESPQIRNFINGEFVEPIGGRYLDNIEPATGKPYSQVADSDAHDVDLAVAAAEKAFRDWSKKTGSRTLEHSAANCRFDRARLWKSSRAPNRSIPVNRFRWLAHWIFRVRSQISDSSPPRFCTPNRKRTSPTTSRSTTHCVSRAASPG